MSDVESILVALFILAIVAVIAGSGQSTAFIQAAGSFLVAMVDKIDAATVVTGAAT